MLARAERRPLPAARRGARCARRRRSRARRGRARGARRPERIGQDDAPADAVRARPALPRRPVRRQLPRRGAGHAPRAPGRGVREGGDRLPGSRGGDDHARGRPRGRVPARVRGLGARGDRGARARGARGGGRRAARRPRDGRALRAASCSAWRSRRRSRRARRSCCSTSRCRSSIPRAAASLALRLRALADAGVCVVVTEHRIERIAAHADRLVRLERGRIVADGPSPEPVGDRPEAPAPRGGGARARRAARDRRRLSRTAGAARRRPRARRPAA